MNRKEVTTIGDVDRWRTTHPCKDGSIMSRYQALVTLWGAPVADNIMRNLEVQSWDMRKLGNPNP